MIGGAIRVSTPFMFVALGECLTEKSGRINLGLEGNLVLGAMVAYAGSYTTGTPWLGVLVAGCAGLVLGAMHGYICKLPKVNDIAIGIAIMSFGTGLAFFFGKPYIQPTAPRLDVDPARRLDRQSARSRRRCRSIRSSSSASRSPSFMWWALANTRWGLIVRMTGDSAASARPWASRSISCASSRPPPAASSPASAARSCRSTIRAAGTRACPRARA